MSLTAAYEYTHIIKVEIANLFKLLQSYGFEMDYIISLIKNVVISYFFIKWDFFGIFFREN